MTEQITGIQLVGDTFILGDGQNLKFAEVVENLDDILNWFDADGNLVIGSRSNPDDVQAWKTAWSNDEAV